MIKYPNKKKRISAQDVQSLTKNRGMSFEEAINKSNDFYLTKDIAHIYKKPTPIKIVKVKVENNNFEKHHKITEAYFEKKSTTDYNGIYKGKHIDFEAKETKYNVFNIAANLHKHQLEHLQHIVNHGGISFLLVSFAKFGEVYLLETEKILYFLETEKNNSQIEREYFREHGYLVEEKIHPQLDYLKVVDQIIDNL